MKKIIQENLKFFRNLHGATYDMIEKETKISKEVWRELEEKPSDYQLNMLYQFAQYFMMPMKNLLLLTTPNITVGMIEELIQKGITIEKVNNMKSIFSEWEAAYKEQEKENKEFKSFMDTENDVNDLLQEKQKINTPIMVIEEQNE